MGAEIVTITVETISDHGTIVEPFKVHKKILCQKIPYFDKMFNEGWTETGTQSATLPDDDPKAFKLLVGWVYGGKIEVPADAEGPIDIYIGLFAMANKFALSRLADEAIELSQCHDAS
jgi:BTB/POZ domain